jgi:hypothetical protein
MRRTIHPTHPPTTQTQTGTPDLAGGGATGGKGGPGFCMIFYFLSG